MNFRFDLIAEYAPFFFQGTLVTIGLSLGAIAIGTILGLFIGIGKIAQNKFIRLPFSWYVTFFRGTPLFVQMLLVHFGLVPLLIGDTNGIIAAIVALSLNSAAYIAEIFRAGRLLYTSDAADDLLCEDRGGRRHINTNRDGEASTVTGEQQIEAR